MVSTFSPSAIRLDNLEVNVVGKYPCSVLLVNCGQVKPTSLLSC